MEPLGRPGCWAHVLVCVNRRGPENAMPSCGELGGDAVWDTLRGWVSQRGLLSKVWVTKTACLGWCHKDGVTVAFYPQGDFYRRVTQADCGGLIARYLEPLLERMKRP